MALPRRTRLVAVVTIATLVALDSLAGAQTAACSEPLREVFRSDRLYNFRAIAAISPDDVWTTGEAISRQLAHWDGESWTLFKGPRIRNRRAYSLVAVDGIAGHPVWAVGSTGYGGDQVILRWDGAGWSHVEIPHVGRASGLFDVAVLDDGTAFAVGFSRRKGHKVKGLVMRYDGRTWSREPLNMRGIRFPISDVDAHVSDAVWAVPAGEDYVLVRSADGWTKEPLPERSTDVTDVAVTPEGSAWLSTRGDVSPTQQPVVLRYSSGTWEQYAVPDRRGQEFTEAVSAVSDDQIGIVGLRYDGGDGASPFAARLSDRSFVHVPAEGFGWTAFWDVALDPSGGMWVATEAPDYGVVERAC